MTKKTSKHETMTAQEAADYLGVTRVTALDWLWKGFLRGKKLGPSKNSPIAIYRDSVEELKAKLDRDLPASRE